MFGEISRPLSHAVSTEDTANKNAYPEEAYSYRTVGQYEAQRLCDPWVQFASPLIVLIYVCTSYR